MKFFIAASLALALMASARPLRRAEFTKQNGQDAIDQNNQFQSLTPDSDCHDGENACVNEQFAQCVGGKFTLTPCAGGTICAALPLVNSPGTSITCTTASDRDSRIAATGATGGGSNGTSSGSNDDNSSSSGNNTSGTTNNSGNNSRTGNNGNGSGNGSGNNSGNNNSNGPGNDDDLQQSLTLDPNVIAKSFADDGQNPPVDGQSPSLTSTNNFINFCLTVPNLPITDGKQVQGGSCNPVPMGAIPAKSKMPSSKFTSPKNLDILQPNQKFTVEMAIKNLDTGTFVNADTKYFAAPQQLNDQGTIIGHSHLVIEELDRLDSTEVTDPTKFAFFKGVNTAAQNGKLSVDVDQGLPQGAYRLCSINSSSNHQGVVVPVAQRGMTDDCVYFTVENNGNNNNNGQNAGNGNNNNNGNNNQGGKNN